ncbi:MAG: glycosyltransferase family 4 protein [Pyrinomonadaceae bacterium]
MKRRETIEKSSDKNSGETKKRPRVLIVAPAKPLVGGQAVQAEQLLENLKNEGSVEVEFQPTNPQILKALQKIKYVRTMVVSAAYMFELLKKIPRARVIHIFSAGDTGFLISTTPAILIAKLFGKKTILHYHHGGAEQHLKNWRRTAPSVIKLFDKIVVPSNFLVDVFAEFNLKAEPIFNIVNTKNYRFRKRETLCPIFLSNRNFDALYNVGCILQAFAVLQKKIPEARLIIAGDGEEREKLHALAKELKLENVEFLGQVAQEKMPALYDRADIYLNSSNVDNMPNSIIEAFAAGTPVVSTGAGGIPFIVETDKTGLLVEKNDSEALAREAIKLLEDKELAKKIIAAAHLECVKYSWENIREKWLELYFNLVNRQP